MNLVFKGVKRIKSFYASQLVKQLHIKALAIQVGSNIKQVHLKPVSGVIHRRLGPKVGDASHPVIIEARLHNINP
jgi:hypothetical protein